jgi:hypothetical protein
VLDLDEMRRLARESLEMLERQDVPDTPEGRGCRESVRAEAGELRARADAPVTVGVVGEFSVGKSLLLGTLLGRPDLLPVESRPTTGNITMLLLTPGRPGQPTRADDTAEVRFLGGSHLAKCVHEILDALADDLDRDHPELGAGAVLRDYDPLHDPGGWSRFDRWLPCLWGEPLPGGTGLPGTPVAANHRDAATELCRLRDAHRNQVDYLGRDALLGQSVNVPLALVRAALNLPQTAAPEDKPPRAVVFSLTASQVQADAKALSDSLPLIERVVLRVRVAPEHWALDRMLAEHEVQMVDFPGIGAIGSNLRDSYLSRTELMSVHTILLVLRADRTEAKAALGFWKMLEADGRPKEALRQAALIASNVFDSAVVPRLPPGPLTGTVLAAGADEINGLQAIAGRFVGDDGRVAVVSSLAAIKHYGLDYPELSDASRHRIDSAVQGLPTSGSRLWEPVADRLEQADPGSAWIGRLRSYDDDGGIKGLQQMIEGHLLEHGRAQKLERAGQSAQKLTAALKALRGQVRLAGIGDRRAEYARLAVHHAAMETRIKGMLAELDALRVSRRGSDPVADTAPRIAAVADAAREAVYSWTEWQQLFDRAENDEQHLVTRSAAPARRPAIEISRVRPRPGASAPAPAGDSEPVPVDSSDTFIGQFVQMVDDHCAGVREAVAFWLKQWAQRHQPACDASRDWWDEPETGPLLDEIYLRRLGSSGLAQRRLDALWEALAPVDLVDAVARHLESPGERAREAWIRHFPARPGHALAWHHLMPEIQPDLDQRERHPLNVVQLRAYTAQAAATLVAQHLADLLSTVSRELTSRYREASAYLLDARQITPPRSQNPGGAQDPAAPGQPAPDQPIDLLLHEWSMD